MNMLIAVAMLYWTQWIWVPLVFEVFSRKILLLEYELIRLQGTKCMFGIMHNIANQQDIPQAKWKSEYVPIANNEAQWKSGYVPITNNEAQWKSGDVDWAEDGEEDIEDWMQISGRDLDRL
jgi:hypothetical protein